MQTNRQGRAALVSVLIVALLMTAGSQGNAAAEWIVYYLNPSDQPGSGGDVAAGAQRAGYVYVGDDCISARPHAAIWEGTSNEWIDLQPPSALYSYANGTNGVQQAGAVIAEVGGDYHAALWSGKPETFVDLHPAGATDSDAYAISGSQQVGTAKLYSPPHAALWEGTAQSFVDLNPTDSEFSAALDTNGKQQVGYMLYDYIYGDSHAALWSGTADSFVDLHPANAIGSSAAFGISPDGSEQGGYVRVQVGSYEDYHAAIWHDDPDTWVDLNPPGAIFSSVRATDGRHQVGQAYVGEGTYDTYRAYYWAGSVDTRVDLHALLPAQYTESEAESVYTDGAGVWVFGYSHRTVVQCNQAILWFLPAELPGDVDLDGDVDIDDLASLLASYNTCIGDAAFYSHADMDSDGCVNLRDLAALLANYGASPR